jgi:phosphohistidine phosphatase
LQVRIYLVRHGDAVHQDEAGSDRDRWLSINGRDAARVLAKLLRDEGVAPAVIVSSPLPRAVQTAELLAFGLDFPGSVMSRRSLEPAGSPRVAAGDVTSLGGNVLVVSHEPMISSLAAIIANKDGFPAFRTAQCCAFERTRHVFTARADANQLTHAGAARAVTAG